MLLRAFEFFLKELAAPFVFYPIFRIYGAKPAIGCALGVTALQFGYHWTRKLRISPILVLASAYTVTFGMIDLLIASPRFFRLEPFLQNFTLATIFLGSVVLRRPVISIFVEGLPRSLRPRGVGPSYLARVTLAWAIYQYSKAFTFLYLAFRVDLADLVAIRSILGGGSAVLMIGGEILIRKWWLRAGREEQSS